MNGLVYDKMKYMLTFHILNVCFDKIQQHQFMYTFKLGAATEKEKSESVAEDEPWSLEEKDRLFQFVTKVFLMNLPMYMAYKHSVNTSLEELSQQEAAALNNYCELSVSPYFVLTFVKMSSLVRGYYQTMPSFSIFSFSL